MSAKIPKELVSASRRKVSMAYHHPELSAEQIGAAVVAAAPTERPKDLVTISDYDQQIGRPQFWSDAKARESVIGELIANEAARDEAQVRRGKLFTRDQLEEREREYDDLVFAELAHLSEFVATLVDPAQRAEAQTRTRAYIERARRDIAKKMKERER